MLQAANQPTTASRQLINISHIGRMIGIIVRSVLYQPEGGKNISYHKVCKGK